MYSMYTGETSMKLLYSHKTSSLEMKEHMISQLTFITIRQVT